MDKLSIMEQLCFSTTRIETKDANGNGYSGTGFFFSYKLNESKIVPLIVTNKHVVYNSCTGLIWKNLLKRSSDMILENMLM